MEKALRAPRSVTSDIDVSQNRHMLELWQGKSTKWWTQREGGLQDLWLLYPFRSDPGLFQFLNRCNQNRLGLYECPCLEVMNLVLVSLFSFPFGWLDSFFPLALGFYFPYIWWMYRPPSFVYSDWGTLRQNKPPKLWDCEKENPLWCFSPLLTKALTFLSEWVKEVFPPVNFFLAPGTKALYKLYI
jgi:hypothetical protein